MLRDKAKSKLVKGSVPALCLFGICTLAMTTMVMPTTMAAGASAAAGVLKSEPRGGVHCHNMRITNYSSATDSSGNIALLGKITNNFTKPISNIRITADLYNANGKLIGIENP